MNKKIALLVCTLGSFITPFMGSSINIALPTIGKEFSMSAITLSWVATSYLLSTAIFLIPFGRISDMYGRKKIFEYGIIIYTLSSLTCAISTSSAYLIGFRIIQGIGGAMIFATSTAILISAYPANERGKALGINVAAVYIGLSAGPFFGGFLTQQFGWRSIFIANLPLGLIAIIPVIWKLEGEWAEAKGEKFDLSGYANLFRNNTVFTFSNIAALINYCATAAVSFFVSLYLQYIKEIGPQGAGLILVSQPVVMAIFSPFAGRLSDKIEPRVIASTGMAVTAAGLSLLIFVNRQTSTEFIMLILILIGFGLALFSSPNTNAVMSSVEKKYYGVALATLGSMRLVGQMVSLGISIFLFSLYLGRARITPENYPAFLGSMKLAFMIFSVLCFAGIFASLARGKVR